MNHLEEMLKLQKDFQEKFNFHPTLHLIASAIMTEAGELWEASGGKWWSKKKHMDDKRREELIDILHFFLAYCVEIGISAEELFERYAQKLSINYKRQFNGY
jgi:NTP pyrophosphatase (non-canonical NTP hydrolase)